MNLADKDIFTTEKRDELLAIVLQVSTGHKNLVDYFTEMKDVAISRETDVRRNALNELAFVVLNLPSEYLSQDLCDFLLEFFTKRLDDSGHLADLLATVIHHLVFAQTIDDDYRLEQLFHAIFDDIGVQAYIQTDREKLLEILEFFVKKHFQIIEKMDVQFYTVFTNAAGGERDPKCLLRVFSIFTHVMKRMNFGALMEEMFELVACYWPIEYEPKLTDKNPISRTALSAACNACLLANQSFESHTYRLISDVLVEDDESVSHEKKLDVCTFLTKACERFGTRSLMPFLNSILAGFRMLTLNPKSHLVDPKTMGIIGETLKAILSNIMKEDQDAEKTVKDMADTMLENCEPFVIQPEMGFSIKALSLLEKMVLANDIICEIVLPRVFYWIHLLITGATVKNWINKDEIVEETVAIIPRWFSAANAFEQIDTIQTNFILSTIRKMDSFSKKKRLKLLCECLRILLKHGANMSDDCRGNINETIKFIVNEFDEYDPELKLPIFDFTSSLPSQCYELSERLEATPKWSEMQFLLYSANAFVSQNLPRCLPMYLMHMFNAENLTETGEFLLLLFDRIKNNYSADLCADFVEPVAYFVFAYIDTCSDKERLKVLGEFFQKFGLLLNSILHSKLIDVCVQQLLFKIYEKSIDESIPAVISLAPFCLQSQKTEVHKMIINSLLNAFKDDKCGQLQPYLIAFYFAYHNRSKDECEDVEISSAKWESEIAKCRSHLLTRSQLPSSELQQIFNSAPSSLLQKLLDFDNELTDPDRCCYRKTLMWAQRIVTQFIPFFVNHFKHNTEEQHQQAMISLIIPTLCLVKRVAIPMVSELELLLPIIIETLHDLDSKQSQILLLATAITQLLQLSKNKSYPSDKLSQISYAAEKLLLKEDSSNQVVYAILEVLEVLARKISSKTQIFRLEQTLFAIRHAIRSKKRLIRQKAAFVRGLWETLPR